MELHYRRPMTPDATSPSLHDLPAGSSFGSYRINRLLGRGGMGAVYEAVHQGDGRVVALKLLSVELDKMDSRERFLREGRTAAAINHPNAVYIYGTEEIDGTPVISMELVPGGTLEEKVQTKGPLPVDEAVEDIVQVIDGLEAALAAGVLHRDVKPANCFVSASGIVKIGDFGLSKPVDGEEQQKLTRTGVFLGTPVFSSPEQLLGETLDARSDIYAVGVTFYYLLTGKLPYSSGSMMQVVAAVLNGEPTPLAAHRPDLPQAVVDVVLKAIARKTADRYQSYDAFRAAVAALRKPETQPATLWDRFRAAVVDVVVIAIINWLLFQIIVGTMGWFWTTASPQGQKLSFVLGITLTMLIIGIPESLRGASIGKWLVGIRVTGPDGGRPGFVRAEGRVLILQSIDFIALVAQLTGTTQNARAGIALVTAFGLRALLFVTVRRSNGWRMTHDVLTGTRVVRPVAAVRARHGEAQSRAAPVLSGTELRIGPYAVTGPLDGSSGVLLGLDESMNRPVWIVPRAAGAPEVPQARRDLARLTRLRWVAGRRSPGESWDAFEAPVAEPLAARLARPVAWSAVQGWMLDLTSELIAATADETLPAALDARSLWVTATDRIIVGEGAGATDGRTNGATPAQLVATVLDMIGGAVKGGSPLPRHATRAIAAAREARSIDEVRALFQETVGRPVSISRVRRAGLVGATIASVLLLPVIAIVPIRQAAKFDTEGKKLSGLLQFIGDSGRALPPADRVKQRPSGSFSGKINRAMEKAGWFPRDTSINRLSPEEYRAQSHLARLYVAGLLAARVRAPKGSSSLGLSPPDQRLATGILKQFATVDSGELRAARVLVDSTWNGTPPGMGVDLLVKVISIVLLVFFPWFIASCAIVIAVLFRRGALMRGFQLDVVTLGGEPAGRARILVRNLVTWSPVLAPFPIYWAVELAPDAQAPLAMEAAGALVLIVTAIGAWISVRDPDRGIADRIAGTRLVPE